MFSNLFLHAPDEQLARHRAAVLRAAASCSLAALREELGENGAADFCDEKGRTPLMLAAAARFIETGGADRVGASGSGLTPETAHVFGGGNFGSLLADSSLEKSGKAQSSFEERRLATLDFLIPRLNAKARDHEGRDALAEAVANENPEAVRKLLPVSDPKGLLNHGANALMLATMHDNIEIMATLAPAFDLRAQDDEGNTALMHAVHESNTQLLDFLLPISDLTQKNSAGETAFLMAAAYGEKPLRALLPHANLADRDNAGQDALMLAARSGGAQAVKILLPLCDPRAQDHRGNTALMHAATRSPVAIARLLLPVSDPMATNADGNDDLMLATLVKDADTTALLAPVSSVFRVNGQGETGASLLAQNGFFGTLGGLFARASDQETELLLLATARALNPSIASRLESFFLAQEMKRHQAPIATPAVGLSVADQATPIRSENVLGDTPEEPAAASNPAPNSRRPRAL